MKKEPEFTFSTEQIVKKSRPKRSERLQGFSIRFPEAAESLGPQINSGVSEQHTTAMGTDSYPELRRWLSDRGLVFKPQYNQREVATIIGKSDKTVRSRTRQKQIPFHCWPWGEVYHTAQDLEDLLTGRERLTKGGK